MLLQRDRTNRIYVYIKGSQLGRINSADYKVKSHDRIKLQAGEREKPVMAKSKSESRKTKEADGAAFSLWPKSGESREATGTSPKADEPGV